MKKAKPHIKFRQSLFWDTNPKRIDTKKHARYIIERILQFGHIDETKWLFHRYQKRTIKKVLQLPRVQVSAKSKGLWSLLLR
jgi:phage-related protein